MSNSNHSSKQPPSDIKEKLEKTQGYLDTILSNMPAGVAILEGPELRYVTINRQLAEINGLPVEDHLGKPLAEVLPDAAPDLVTRLHEVLETGEPSRHHEFSTRLPKDPSEVRWFEDAFFPLQGTDGKPFAVGAVVVEITESKQAEAQLRESEEKFRLVTEAIEDVFWLSTPEIDQILYISPAYAQLWGRSVDEVYESPTSWVEAIHPQDRERILCAFKEFAQGRFDHEYRIVRPDGSVRWIRDRGYPIRDEDGNVRLMAGVARDITKRKQAEKEIQRLKEELEQRVMDRTAQLQVTNKELEKGQERLAEAQQIAHLGTLEWDLQTNELLWSDECYRLLGFAPQEVEPTVELFLACVHPEDREHVESTISKMKAEAEAHPYEYRILRPDGEVRMIYSRPKVHCDEDGKVIRVLGTMLDVTELKKLEEQLLQSQKMDAIGRLAGGVAHDFNNMLTGIMGFAELLHSQLPDDPKIRSDLSQIQGLAERAKTLTHQLLLFSRQQPVQERVLNLNTLIESTLTMLRRIIGEDIHLKFVPDPELGNVRADQSQLGQVFLNLAVNARDAMPEGGKLTVETANVMLDGEGTQAEPGPYVRVTVTDTGSGMDTQTQQKIFDPFFTTKEVGEGTGLGLSTVHGIIKQHGGAITVSSEPDKGATFKLYFPRVETPAEELPAEPRQEVQPAGGETILVVEDEQTIRILIQRVLEIQGYQVFCASNAGEAEQIFARQVGKIDLLLTDVVMPGDSGPKLYKGLAVKHPLLKALFISGYTEQRILQNDLVKPDMPFLQKPFEPSKLSQKVREVLDTRKKEDQIN